MQIIIKNLPLTVRQEEIREMFEKYGPVKQVHISKEPYTGEVLANVEMKEGGSTAINELNGRELKGQSITVADAESDDTFKNESQNER